MPQTGKHNYTRFVCQKTKDIPRGLIVVKGMWIQTAIINAN